ncbi:transporter substrate-binding domain-containing protein [Endozoicomonas arenosclerae]|uniref:transporter substrate-binding domain-containing protein n=1 Tax=Endozoicomonas arenosclerae TaxID=1633495 RepID=UPI000783F3F4|nr:transporter substrate-binding domain-containing protein [Endozoicomonas arenosclerae]
MKSYRQCLLFFVALLSMLSSSIQAAPRETVTLCSDKAYWFPFTYLRDYRAAGLFIDMIKEVGLRTHTRFVIRPANWTRCLRLARQGKVDGILGASYKEERAQWMYYPDDATSSKPSSFSMSLVDYVIATPLGSQYRFKGDTSTLPAPVRVPKSYSIASDLEKKGVDVKASFASDRAALLSLVKQKNGSAALLGSIANQLAVSDGFLKGQYQIQSVKLKAKDYFLTFSHKSAVSEDKRDELWGALKSVRSDDVLMSHLYENYADSDS